MSRLRKLGCRMSRLRKLGCRMSRLRKLGRRLCEDDDGASLIEYTALLAIMLVAVIAVIAAVGGWINNKWTALNSALP